MKKDEFIGQKVRKLSGKPFKSTFKINTVKGIEINLKTGNDALTFLEDDSLVDVYTCEVVTDEEHEVIETHWKLHLFGYLHESGSDELVLEDSNRERLFNIPKDITEFGHKYGTVYDTEEGLGGTQVYIDRCNLRFVVSDKECTLEDAEGAMLDKMFGGNMYADLEYCGYSEFTITGLDVTELTIGGHDISEELKSYMSKYIHLVLECN